MYFMCFENLIQKILFQFFLEIMFRN